ncbi:f-box family protein [Corchorus olitorius]|uniref:F-box family protein n=1 Tax=Corchorus olitorius TaxID=93759 RepID=A0A1R3KMW6_9ROSI|nr:f-box family protein [Corchorus olitorius]
MVSQTFEGLLLISLLPSAGRLVANELATEGRLLLDAGKLVANKSTTVHVTPMMVLVPASDVKNSSAASQRTLAIDGSKEALLHRWALLNKSLGGRKDNMGLLTFAAKEILGGTITEQLIKPLGIHLNHGIPLEQVMPKTLVSNPKWSGSVNLSKVILYGEWICWRDKITARMATQRKLSRNRVLIAEKASIAEDVAA